MPSVRTCVFTERRNWPLTPALIRSYLQAHPHRVPGVMCGVDVTQCHTGRIFTGVDIFSGPQAFIVCVCDHVITPLHLVSTCSFLPLTFVGAKEAQASVSKGRLSGARTVCYVVDMQYLETIQNCSSSIAGYLFTIYWLHNKISCQSNPVTLEKLLQ